jgi:hypothetical protein
VREPVEDGFQFRIVVLVRIRANEVDDFPIVVGGLLVAAGVLGRAAEDNSRSQTDRSQIAHRRNGILVPPSCRQNVLEQTLRVNFNHSPCSLGSYRGTRLLAPLCLLELTAPILKKGRETPDGDFFDEDVSNPRNVDTGLRGRAQF